MTDLQALADLGRSLEVVRTMHGSPVTRDAALVWRWPRAPPIVPLALTMMPFEELVKKLFGMLF